jgi:hypothetical protein
MTFLARRHRFTPRVYRRHRAGGRDDDWACARALAGYFGGLVNEVIMRYIDIFLTVLSLILRLRLPLALRRAFRT